MMLDRVAAAGLLLALPACTTIGEVRPTQFIPQRTPALVWVTTTNNAMVAVAQPQIDGDTLRGTWVGTQTPLAIPLQDIQSVQAQTPARTRTVLAFITAGLVAEALIRSLTQSGTRSEPDPCPGDDGCM